MLDQRNLLRELDGVIADFQWYARYLTDAEVKADYLRAALRSLDRGYSHIYPDSLGNKTAGEVGPFSIVDGTWSYTDSEIENSAIGTIAMSSGQVYGAWYLQFNKPSFQRVIDMLIASVPEVYTNSSQNGYMLYIDNSGLLRIFTVTSGVVGATPITGVAGTFVGLTDYQVFITRDSASLWSFYAKGGAYTNWTLLDTGTESTHTKCLYTTVSCNLGAGGKRCKHLFFPYGGSLSPNDVPWLAD
jgi:hypothetical protein